MHDLSRSPVVPLPDLPIQYPPAEEPVPEPEEAPADPVTVPPGEPVPAGPEPMPATPAARGRAGAPLSPGG